MRRFALLLWVCAAPAMAEEPMRVLPGPEIRAALTDRVVAYENARQEFRASGRTLYTFGGRDSWGSWRIEGDRYGSQCPPADLWDCYDVFALEDRVLFVGSDNNAVEGRYAD
ncbi:MAG: hypothetical protein AAFY39_17830 [Pseudomonadota bacterium]